MNPRIQLIGVELLRTPAKLHALLGTRYREERLQRVFLPQSVG
jgi:hypothetical protein